MLLLTFFYIGFCASIFFQLWEVKSSLTIIFKFCIILYLDTTNYSSIATPATCGDPKPEEKFILMYIKLDFLEC